VYAATVEGQHLTFEVHGVWRKNMIIRDRETGTIWQQATGEAVDGPLKGAQLEILPAWETTWGELSASIPEAEFSLEPEKFTGLMPKRMLERALHSTEILNVDGLSPRDTRLPQHELIIGVVISGAAKAYPLALLQSLGTVEDNLGGETLQIEYYSKGDRVDIQTQDRQPVQHQRGWWLGWSEFHPRSEVFSPQD